MKDEKVLLGTINGLFGVKGWVKVFSYTQPRHNILEYKNWLLGDEQNRPLEVELGQAHKSGVIAKLKGIDSRDAAVLLLNKNIWVSADQLDTLPDNEYYWYQLIGMDVYDCENKRIGKIKELMETGANDVIVVSDTAKSEHLIPYIREQVVKTIDLQNNKMVVDWDINF